MTLDDLKTQIRQNLTVDKLIAKEITSHITITDADVANFYNANKASFNLAEPQIHLAQILVTPTPDPNVRNLKNSKAQNETEAKQKITDIERRLKQRARISPCSRRITPRTPTPRPTAAIWASCRNRRSKRPIPICAAW